jgi:amino acid adenylation domain-containing protein
MNKSLHLADASLPSPQDRDWPIHLLFEFQVKYKPLAEALISSTERLNYFELNERANQLAHFMRDRGLRRGDLVGIALPRTVDLVIGLLATLKLGASYVPLDPSYPTERLNFMLSDSGCFFVLTTSSIASCTPITSEVIKLDEYANELRVGCPTNPDVPVDAGDLAYVMYTSGSTGKPKGVAIEHRSLTTFMHWTRSFFSAVELDGVLAATSICFDLSVFEIFAPLCWGGRVILAKTILELEELPNRSEVKLVNTVPSAMREILTLGALPDSVCTICLAGEAFPITLVRQLRDVSKPLRVLNLYGPTEDTIYSTAAQVDLASNSGPPIGCPLPGTRTYIVDEEMKLCPEGVAGELLLGGDGLARGYFGHPELTAERFLPDKFSDNPADRIYRTGDRVRLQSDGQLIYLGRVDNQVKIRGHRVELGEIERTLCDVESEAEWIVAVAEEPGGGKAIAAYYCGLVTLDRLRDRLAEVLPLHMIPSIFVKLQSIPQTPNGKLDRNRLPIPDWSARVEGLAADSVNEHALAISSSYSLASPLTHTLSDVEARLLEFCREILGYPYLRVDQPLLEAGFHSLAFTQLAWRIRRTFGVSPAFSELFARRTISELAVLVEARSATRKDAPESVATRRSTSDLPLSFAQEGIWFLEKLHPRNLAYHFQSVLQFHGSLDIRALEAALNEMVERHEILRTSFPEIGGRPSQRIHPYTPFALLVENCSSDEAEERIAHVIRTPFDFMNVPPVRWILFAIAPDEHLLLHAEHHLLHDGWEYEVFLRELFTSFDALLSGRLSQLPPLMIQFADFAIWQRKQFAASHWDDQLAYWEKRLHDAPAAAQLPTDRVRPTAATFSGDQFRHTFTPEFYMRLLAVSAREGVTPFMWLHATFQAFLHRYTGQEDIIVGTGVANRQSAQAQQLLGMIINTVALRVGFYGQPTFRELLSRVREAILEALDHQSAPFDKIVERLAPGAQLFNTFFDIYDRTFPSYHNDALHVERRDVVNNGSCKFDLVVLVIPNEVKSATLLWEYSTDLFNEATASRMMQHFLILLEASIANPELAVAALPILSADEKTNIISSGNGKANPPTDRRVDQIFTERATARPDATAIVNGDDLVSYRKLVEDVNDFAGQLCAYGLRPGQVVALSLPRGPRAICAMLAIMQCDCAFLPIDPKLPGARRDQLLQIGAAEILITAEHIVRLPKNEPAPKERVVPASAAYVLFTSGSTGVPKAVCVPHRAVIRLVCDVDYMHLDFETRFLHLAPLSFDACMLEIWGALLNGGTIVVHPDDVPDLVELGATIAVHRVTTAWLTASLFNHIIDTNLEILRPLRELLIGGETVSVPHVMRALAALPHINLINGYGPTENGTFTTTFNISRNFDAVAHRVPIGRPLPDTQVYVLNECQEVQPIGVLGEIYVGGSGVALGYLGDETLTRAKFLPDKIGERTGGRLYRTGDLGRFLADSNLDFVSRQDDQVKVRGFRVEPGEIEFALVQHSAVQNAAVTVWSEDFGTRLLAGYVVLKPNCEMPDLRSFLLKRLPEYMVPTHIIALGALPMLPNGKLDRLMLPRSVIRKGLNAAWVAPRTPGEEVIAGIWTAILKLERIGVHDDFFSSGGHSLLALQLLHAINAAYNMQLPLRLLFENRTVARQATEIERIKVTELRDNLAYPLLVPLRADGTKIPFFLVAGGFGGEAELLVYAALTRHMDNDRPFYGLRIRGVDELVEPATVQEMAAEHIVEIRRVQKTGPYFIGGSCIGGVVAFEIAQQLSNQGEHVEMLVLVDSRFPSKGWYWSYRLRHFWRFDLAPLAKTLYRNPTTVWLALKQTLRLTSPPPEYQVDREKKRIGMKYLRGLLRYAPQPYSAPVTLIICQENMMRDPTWKWRDVIRSDADIQYVPGNHFTHLRAMAASTAARLDACLEAAGHRLQRGEHIRLEELTRTADLDPRSKLS